MPCCDLKEAHYHCVECGEVVGLYGHYVGVVDQIICDRDERIAALMSGSEQEG